MAKTTYEFFDYSLSQPYTTEFSPVFTLLKPIPTPTQGKIISAKITLTVQRFHILNGPADAQTTLTISSFLATCRMHGLKESYTYWNMDRVLLSLGSKLSVGQRIEIELLNYIDLFDISNSTFALNRPTFNENGTTGTNPYFYSIVFYPIDNNSLPNSVKTTSLLITVADVPERPTPVSPMSGDNINPSTATTARFSWIHNRSPETGFPQKGYELQVSSDNLNWTTFSDSTANQFADIPLASLPVGRVFWRVRTIDADDVPSDYSVSQFFNIGSPSNAPTIITSVFDSSRPTLEWTTDFAQKAYHVQINYGNINIVDIYAETAEQFYTVPVALANYTQYIVRVRAKDSSGVFSDWAEDAISTDYSVPGIPSFFAIKKNNIIEITIDNSDDGDEVIRNDIYRFAGSDWVRIGTTQSGTYYDWSAPNGTVEYKVSAVGTSGETFSEVVSVDCFQRYGVLLSVADPYQTHSVKYNFDDKHTHDTGPVLMEFAGRGVPVAEFDEFERRAISLTYTTKSYSEYTKLESMLKNKSIMLYRDRRQKMYGVCTNVGATRENTTGTLYAVSFVLSETEYDEAIII